MHFFTGMRLWRFCFLGVVPPSDRIRIPSFSISSIRGERSQCQIADALALEVQGTPTLFLNGLMLSMLFPNGQMVPAESQFTAIKWLIQFELKVIPPADACCMAGPEE